MAKERHIENKTLVNIIVGVLLLGIGLGLGYLIFNTKSSDTAVPGAIRENSSDYKFINPLLLSLRGEYEEYEGFAPLKKSIDEQIKDFVATKKATEVSVYFRDLDLGQWTGVNYNEPYAPGSMLKVAVLMAYLQLSELNPSILSGTITVAPSSINLDNNQYFKPEHPIQPGRTYTKIELLRAMIVDSDNNATNLLAQELGEDKINYIYSALQLPIENSLGIDYMSPKLYSRLYRTLYNSSFLSQRESEQVLQILSQANFKQGLVAGVPADIEVAHKFGELGFLDDVGKLTDLELHDCGIIYYPRHPYFLCVMTKGSDYPTLGNVIAAISKTVWEAHDKLYR